jgi:hypothetical protein
VIDLGRRRRHDPASRRFESPHRRPTAGLSVRHRLGADHVDQFFLGGCVGYSGTNLLNTRPAWRSRRLFNSRVAHGRAGTTYLGNDDGLTNYSESTRRDPIEGTYPPNDTGSSALGLMKYWRHLGVITGYDWIISGGMDALLASLQHQPVLVGSYWFDDMMSTGERGVVTSACDQPLEDTGGHEYLANAILWPDNPRRRLIGFEQSWGEEPEGFAPTFYMGWDLVEHLVFGLAGDVAVPRLL